MFTVRVSATGRDVRSLRKWSHSVRSGQDVTIGCSGVVVEPGLVLAPLGTVLDGWQDVVVSVNGKKASKWVALDASVEFWEFRFCLISCDGLAGEVVRPSVKSPSLVVEQFALHLTQPLWGLLVQPCRIVAAPSPAVSLIDVSCYEGGEGGLVWGGASNMILARGLSADNAPTGLSVCVSIPFLLRKEPSPSASPPTKSVPVVMVRGLEGRWGTGFLVGSEGVVVTAAHVVCGKGERAPTNVDVVMNAGQGSIVRASIEECWPGGWLDVCVMKISRKPETYLLLAEDDPVPGDAVKLLSATQWQIPMETEGSVMSCPLGVQLVCNVVAMGGCSGGPLVHVQSGKVAGLLVSTAAVSRIRRPRLALCLPVSIWGRFVLGKGKELVDQELQKKAESVWQNDKPDLPPKFKEFLSKL